MCQKSPPLALKWGGGGFGGVTIQINTPHRLVQRFNGLRESPFPDRFKVAASNMK